MTYFKITAKYIFDGKKFLPPHSVLIFDQTKKIVDIQFNQNILSDDIYIYDGLITPGFINSHCHLELSYLQNKIEKNIGLIRFLLEVITKRHIFKIDEWENKIQKTIDDFEKEGVVAIGDICNTTDSIPFKVNSSIYFKNFIEVIGFDKNINFDKIKSFEKILHSFQKELPQYGVNFVPHAPYSLSHSMFEYYHSYFNHQIISIHNQECQHENFLYQSQEGAFVDFYKQLGISIDFFNPTHKSSIQSIFNYLQNAKKILLVHNTFTNQDDVKILELQHPHIFYCLCPNANLYIENQLPPIDMFFKNKIKLVLGTDSFASNSQLSILEEIKTIQNYFPQIYLKDVLQWATLNGAEALGLEEHLGSFEINKSPGLVGITNIQNRIDEPTLSLDSKAHKINDFFHL